MLCVKKLGFAPYYKALTLNLFSGVHQNKTLIVVFKDSSGTNPVARPITVSVSVFPDTFCMYSSAEDGNLIS